MQNALDLNVLCRPACIGLFDSGVGGLSILRSLQSCCLNSRLEGRFVYLADSGRCPYGDRSVSEIRTYVRQIVGWFNQKTEIDLLLMACNTSAALAKDIAVKESKVPVCDLIEPAAAYAALSCKRVGVIATSATINSKAFFKRLKELNPEIEVCEIACPDLVPLVERGLLSGAETDSAIKKYADSLKKFEIDSLIFGCTHFPFLESAFRKQLPPEVKYIDPALCLMQELFKNFRPAEIAKQELSTSFKRNQYFTSASAEGFATAAEQCLELSAGELFDSVKHLSLDELQEASNSASMPAAQQAAAAPAGL